RAVPREVSNLVTATNHLLGQVQNSITEKNAFIANAAHQLRNPIAGLLSQAEAAERTQDSHLLRERISDVTEAARRTSRLTQQLLSMERISQGTLEGSFQEFNLIPVVRERLADIAALAHKQRIDISLQCHESTVMIHGNPLLIGEVFDNLLDNALRYGCNEGGRIDVYIAVTHMKAPSPQAWKSEISTVTDGWVEVSVNDDGCGIPDALLPKLFERFTRGTEDGSGGCGLGLAISRSIISAHSGEITVSSSAQGTQFTVRLPHLPIP
ncbi:MAG: sensor histidine kinase, partial [Thiolinea sp.]